MSEITYTSKDVPRVDGGTVFVIFSKLERVPGGKDNVIPSRPEVGYTPVVTCDTGFRTASGGYSTSALTIRPVISGNSISWEIMGFRQLAEESGALTLSVTTNGDDEAGVESVTVEFTFQVLLLGRPVAIGGAPLYTFRVGETMPAMGRKVPLPLAFYTLVSYSTPDGTELVDEEGRPCGLYLTPDPNDPYPERLFVLKGVADRPGVFGFTLRSEFYEEGAARGVASKNYPNCFPGGETRLAFLVAVVEQPFTEGVVIAAAPAKFQPKLDFLRLNSFSSSHPWMWNAGGEYAGNGSAWSRTEKYTEYIDSKFRIEKEGGSWVFYVMNWTKQDAPFWEEIERFTPTLRPGLPPAENQEIPPNNWPSFRFSGSGDYLVTRNGETLGYFDFKGELEYKDADGNTFTRPYYEQAALYVPQYEHVKNQPPAVRYNRGMYLYWKQSLEAYVLRLPDGAEYRDFEMTAPALAALPFVPPEIERIGDHVVRDLQADGLSLHRAPGDLCFRVAKLAGGYWAHYPAARRFVPYNGTAGSTYFGGSITWRHTTKNNSKTIRNTFTLHSQGNQNHVDPTNGESQMNEKNTDECVLSMTLRPCGGFRNGDVPTAFLFAGKNYQIAENYERDYKKRSVLRDWIHYDWVTVRTTIETETSKITGRGGENAGVGVGQISLISAPIDGGRKNGVFANGSCAMKAVKTVEVTNDTKRVFTYDDPTPGTPEITESRTVFIKDFGGNMSASSRFPVLLGSALACRSIKSERGSKTYYLDQYFSNREQNENGTSAGLTEYTGEVSLTWSGNTTENTPGMSRGKSRVFITENTRTINPFDSDYKVTTRVIVDDTFDDPMQTIFNKYKADYQNFSWYNGAPPARGVYGREETRTESENVTVDEITWKD